MLCELVICQAKGSDRTHSSRLIGSGGEGGREKAMSCAMRRRETSVCSLVVRLCTCPWMLTTLLLSPAGMATAREDEVLLG